MGHTNICLGGTMRQPSSFRPRLKRNTQGLCVRNTHECWWTLQRPTTFQSMLSQKLRTSCTHRNRMPGDRCRHSSLNMSVWFQFYWKLDLPATSILTLEMSGPTQRLNEPNPKNSIRLCDCYPKRWILPAKHNETP